MRTAKLSRRRFAALFMTARCCASAERRSYPEIRKQLAGRDLYLLPFSHVDWAWVNSRAWMVRRHAQVLAEALDLLREDPGFRFYIETWNEQMEPFLDRKPERIGELRKALQAGKFEACGGVCNQHPAWMEQESLIRDMVMGRRLFEKFAPGLNLEVMIHNDVTPGPSQMPQLLRKAGYRYYRVNRPDALAAEGVPIDFQWRGLDGTSVITSRGSTCGFIDARSLPDDFAANWHASVEVLYRNEIDSQLALPAGIPVWMPVGCDDSRPLRFWQPAPGQKGGERLLPISKLIQQWNRDETSHMRVATPLEFFRDLEKRGPLPVHEGVLDPCMWTYWYGLNGNNGLRYWRTRADQALAGGEALWNCAALAGESYPQSDFERLWRELLRVYSHAQMWLFTEDYDVQLNRLKATLLEAERLRHNALRALTRRINADGNRSCVVLFNELPWERTEVVPVWVELQDKTATNIQVSDASGGRLEYQVTSVNWYDLPGGKRTIRELAVLVQAHVPALGYTTLYFDPVPGALPLSQRQEGARKLEAGGITAQFSGGGIDSVTDQTTGAVYRGLGNVIYNRIKDTGPLHYGPVVETERWTDAQIVETVAGPLRSSFVISGKIGPHAVRLSGHIYPHTRRITFDTEIESGGGSGHFMAVAGLPAPGRLSADVAFGVEPRDVSKIRYGGLERKRENVFYAAHWCDSNGDKHGLTFITTMGEKGFQYTPAQNELGHFLLMTNPPVTDTVPPGAESWERFVTPAREGRGIHRFDYQFLLHAKDWRQDDIPRRALEARFPPVIMQLEEQKVPAQRDLPLQKSFLALQGRGVQLSSFYREGSACLVRVHEMHGAETEASLQLAARPKRAREVDLNRNPLQRDVQLSGTSVRIRLRPWEIVTLELDL